jgi:hypothetical protein
LPDRPGSATIPACRRDPRGDGLSGQESSVAASTGGVRGFVATHLSSRQVSRVIYGSIIGLALVVALEAHPPPPRAMVATLIGTAVAVALAELYSELVGFETVRRRKVRRSELRELRTDIAAVATGVAFPALFFLLAGAGVMENDTAFDVAKWTGLGLIGVYGFAGARLSGAGLIPSLLQAAAVAAIGAALIVLKSLVH